MIPAGNGKSIARKLLLFVRGGTWRFPLTVFALVAAAVPAHAEIVQLISANVSPTPVYFGNPAFPWNVPSSSTLTNTTVVGQSGGFGFIAVGGFSWAADLDTDLSSGGLADATFVPGGSFEITGTYTGPGGPLVGSLLQGTVSAFRWTESAPNSDFLNTDQLVATLTPTGGALMTNPALNLGGQYYLDATVAGAQQNGGPVLDFQSDIVAVQSLQFTLTLVPEPTTAMRLSLF